MHAIKIYVLSDPVLILPDSVHFFRLCMLYEKEHQDMNINVVLPQVMQYMAILLFPFLHSTLKLHVNETLSIKVFIIWVSILTVNSNIFNASCQYFFVTKKVWALYSQSKMLGLLSTCKEECYISCKPYNCQNGIEFVTVDLDRITILVR